MGVDASYLYGYGGDISGFEWDIIFLKEKYKNRLDEKCNNYSWSPSFNDAIETIDNYLNDVDNEIDWYEIGEALGFDVSTTYDSEYLTFNHKHLAEMFPDSKLSEFDELSKLYAKELGIKNYEDVKWIEFGYFD